MVANHSSATDIPAATTGTDHDDLRTRRRFLAWLIGFASGAFVLAFAVPALALRTLTGKTRAVAKGDRFVVAAGSRAGSPVTMDAIPVGTALQVFPAGKTKDQDNLVQLVHLKNQSGQSLVAYSAICTHLGCSVLAQLNSQGNIACPCHGSIFDPANHAAVVSGPAGRPLPALPIHIDDSGAIVAAGTFDAPVGPE